MTSSTRALAAILEDIGLGWFHVFAVVALALCCSAESIMMISLSFLQPCIMEPLGVSLGDSAWLSTANFTLACLAAPAIMVTSELYGRKVAVIVPACILALSLLAGTTLSATFAGLVVCLGLAGIGQGSLIVAIILAAEVAPPSVRGSYVNIINW